MQNPISIRLKKSFHFFDLFKKAEPVSEDQLLKIAAPAKYFERAEVFFDDVRHIKEKDFEYLNHTFFIQFLVDTLLTKIRHGKNLSDYVKSLVDSYNHILETDPVWHSEAEPDNFWMLFSRSDSVNPDEIRRLHLRLPSSDVLRLEIFLDEQLYSKYYIGLTADRLISLLFLEFITNVKESDSETGFQHLVDAMVGKLEEFE